MQAGFAFLSFTCTTYDQGLATRTMTTCLRDALPEITAGSDTTVVLRTLKCSQHALQTDVRAKPGVPMTDDDMFPSLCYSCAILRLNALNSTGVTYSL
jgi:hypothetical protein